MPEYDVTDKQSIVARIMKEGRITDYQTHEQGSGEHRWLVRANITFVLKAAGYCDVIFGTAQDDLRVGILCDFNVAQQLGLSNEDIIP
jgi:hypothetical protein